MISVIAPLIALPSLAMLLLLCVSAFASACETAMFYLSPDELRTMRVGRSRERAVAALMNNPNRVLTAVLFWNLITNMTYFAVSVVMAGRLSRAGFGTAAGLSGLLALALMIMFGEVIPKSVAVVFRRRIAVLGAWPLAFLIRLLDPVAPPLVSLTAGLRRAFWPHLVPEPLLNATDLERAVEASTQSREVVQKERQVLHNVLDLSEIRVEEAMRPRGSFRIMTPPIRRDELRGVIPPGSFVAIREADADDLDRVLPLLELSALPETHLESKAVPLVHVPWCATLADTLQLVRARNAPAASVVNEHGETIGLITRDDLMDALFLPETDRTRRLWKRDPVAEVAPGNFHVEGVTTLRHLCARLGLEYEPDEDGNVTVAGLLTESLEHFPEVGETLVWRGFEVSVLDVSARSIRRVLFQRFVEPLPAPTEPEARPIP